MGHFKRNLGGHEFLLVRSQADPHSGKKDMVNNRQGLSQNPCLKEKSNPSGGKGQEQFAGHRLTVDLKLISVLQVKRKCKLTLHMVS